MLRVDSLCQRSTTQVSEILSRKEDAAVDELLARPEGDWFHELVIDHADGYITPHPQNEKNSKLLKFSS